MKVVLIGKCIAHQQIMVHGWLKIVQKPVENAAVEMFALKLTTIQVALNTNNNLDAMDNIKIGWLPIVQKLAHAEKRTKLIVIFLLLACFSFI